MPFNNPITGAQGSLVRPDIKSPNYVAGSTGWSINQNGTAEFNSVTARGTVNVNGINNSFIDIVLDNTGLPFIFIKPEDLVGHTTGDGQIDAFYGTNNAPGLEIISPTIDGGASAAIQLFGTDTIATPPSINFNGDATFNDAVNHLTDTDFLPAAATTEITFWGVITDTLKRLAIDGNGHMAWGVGGNTARDTVLYRASAGNLAVDNLLKNVSGSAETWHSMSLVNGWANSGGSDPTAQYRLVPSPANCVQIVGSIHGGTNANGTTIATLPVGYRPATHKVLFPTAVDVLNGSPRMTLNTNGTLTIDNSTSAAFIFFNQIIPLDA